MRFSRRITALAFAGGLAAVALATPAAATLEPAPAPAPAPAVQCSNTNLIGNVINLDVPIISSQPQGSCNNS
ncbi:hypothetical protein [Spongiactinospora sp. 9N601]|uniref:hypothetical protein n=1 Tax=Spongiactinospora sp. 9N601 TaxID=3375149 RepID=UPI003794875B